MSFLVLELFAETKAQIGSIGQISAFEKERIYLNTTQKFKFWEKLEPNIVTLMALGKLLLFIASYHLKAIAYSASHAEEPFCGWHKRMRKGGFLQTSLGLLCLLSFPVFSLSLYETVLCLEDASWAAAQDFKMQRVVQPSCSPLAFPLYPSLENTIPKLQLADETNL